MSDSLSNTTMGNSGLDVESAVNQGKAAWSQGKAALGQGVKAAREGVRTAREGIEYASEHVNDGVDFAKSMASSLSDFVARQPLVAVAGAFLVGYLAARMLRRVSS